MKSSAKSGRHSLALFAFGFVCLALPPPARAQESSSADELLSQTRRARDAKEFSLAEQLAREGVKRFHDPVWPITLSLILTDEGQSRAQQND